MTYIKSIIFRYIMVYYNKSEISLLIQGVGALLFIAKECCHKQLSNGIFV